MHLLLFNLATDADDPVLGFTTTWISAFAARFQYVDVITMRAGKIDLPHNVRLHSVGKEKKYGEPRRALEFYRCLFRVLTGAHVDLCFSHMIPVFSILAAPVLKMAGVPLFTWYAHPSLTPTLKLAHFLSDRMVTSIASAYPYRPDKLVVLGQGIDTDLFAPDGSEPQDPPLILCVGRLSPVKNHSTLLRAALLLRDRWPRPFQLVILGGPAVSQDESYVRALKAEVRSLDLLDTVRFESSVPHLQLPAWYRRSTVNVNLTPTGSGDKVVLEAMACAKPCILANPGFRDLLGPYAPALSFAYGDAHALAQRLQNVLDLSPPMRRQIGDFLRERVLASHSLTTLADRLLALLPAGHRAVH